MQLTWLMLTVFSLAKQNVRSEETLNIIPPLVYDAYLNQPDPAIFTCHVRRPTSSRWIIDGYQADSYQIWSRGITVSYNTETVPDYVVAKVFIPATSVNSHGVRGKCRGYSSGTQYIESNETVYFGVQGLLEMYPNVTSTSLNSSHQVIEWIEPFSLNISDIVNDITCYTFCLNISGCTNTTTTEYTLPKYYVNIEIEISAWNIVGESENSALYLINSCHETDRASDSAFVYGVEVAFEGNQTSVLLNFISSSNELKMSSGNTLATDICLYYYEVTIFDRNISILNASIYDGPNSLFFWHNFQRNTDFTVFFDRFSSTNHMRFFQTHFSTYSIQNVIITEDEHTVTTTCQFTPGSDAQGFDLFIECQTGFTYFRRVNMSDQCRERFNNTNPSLCKLLTKVFKSDLVNCFNFTLTVHAWEKDGSTNKVFSRASQGITFATTMTTTVTEKSDIHTTTEIQIQNSSSVIDIVIGSASGGVTTLLLLALFILLCSLRCCHAKIKKSRSTYSPEMTVEVINQKESSPDAIHENEAYAMFLQLKQNEAYQQVREYRHDQDEEQPHVYDEIGNTMRQLDPVYAEVSDRNL